MINSIFLSLPNTKQKRPGQEAEKGFNTSKRNNRYGEGHWKVGMYSRRTELSHEPTDGSTDVTDLTPEEQEAITVPKKPTAFKAKGMVRTTEQATVYVEDLDMFNTVQLLKDSPAELNISKLCDEPGVFF